MIKFKSQRVETCCEKHEKNKKTKEQEPDIEPRFFFFSHFILYHENSFSFFSHSPCSNRRRPTAVKKEDQQTIQNFFMNHSKKETWRICMRTFCKRISLLRVLNLLRNITLSCMLICIRRRNFFNAYQSELH